MKKLEKIDDRSAELMEQIQSDVVCEICGKEFETKNQLRGHMLVHRKEKKESKEKPEIDSIEDIDENKIYKVGVLLTGRNVQQLETIRQVEGYIDISELIRELIRDRAFVR